MLEVHKRLNAIQKELKAPKGQTNNFGKYKYRSCEDILEAVKPILGDAVLLLSDEVVCVGNRNYVKASATLSMGSNEESVSVDAYACEAEDKKGMDSSQITGAASSYARKYALNGLFCIDDTKDADTMNNKESTAQERAVRRKAIDWANDTLSKLEGMDSDSRFDWSHDNKEVLDKLQKKHPDLYRDIMQKVKGH